MSHRFVAFISISRVKSLLVNAHTEFSEFACGKETSIALVFSSFFLLDKPVVVFASFLSLMDYERVESEYASLNVNSGAW